VSKDKSSTIYVPGETTKTMAELSDHVYSCPDTCQRKGGPEVLRSYKDDSTGFQATAYKLDNGKVAVVYAGTNEKKDRLGTWPNIAFNVAHGPDKNEEILNLQIKQARTFYNDIANDYGRVSLLAGHSLGGALAQVVSAEKGVPTETFNAPGMATFIQNFREKNPDYKFQGTQQITNHIRSTDATGNLGRHAGHVVEYQIPQLADHDRAKLAEDLRKGGHGVVKVDTFWDAPWNITGEVAKDAGIRAFEHAKDRSIKAINAADKAWNAAWDYFQ
jgi:hypothetical protein